MYSQLAREDITWDLLYRLRMRGRGRGEREGEGGEREREKGKERRGSEGGGEHTIGSGVFSEKRLRTVTVSFS